MLLVDESVMTPKDIIQNATSTSNNMERKKTKQLTLSKPILHYDNTTCYTENYIV